MTQIFANRAELMPVGETTEEHKKWQEEEAALVEKDRSNTGPRGGLFRGSFKRGALGRRMPPDYEARGPIRDDEDGVDRCPRCTWELEDGLCQSCGYPSEDDELSDSEAPDYWLNHPDDVYGDGDDMDRAILDVVDREGNIHEHIREYSPAYLSEDDYPSEEEYEEDARAREHERRERIMAGELRRLQRNRDRHTGLNPYLGEAGTPYDSVHEETDEDSEEEDAASLDGFVVDDAGERHHSPSSSIRSLQWETDDGSGDEDMRTHDTEDGFETEASDNSDQDDDSALLVLTTDRHTSEEDSDEGPIPPSRRQITRRAQSLNGFSSDDDGQPVAMNRRQRRRNAVRERSNVTLEPSHSIPHHSRAAGTDMERSSGVPIEVDSDSDAPISASQSQRNRRVPRASPQSEGPESGDSSGTATVGRLSPRSRVNELRDSPSGTRGSNESAAIMIESSPRRPRIDADRQSANENVSPANESSVEPPRYSDNSFPRTFPHWNQPLDDPHWPPPNSSDPNRSPAASTPGRRNPANQRLSPLPPWSHRHSPPPGFSRPTTSEEQVQQGLRDRQVQKAERKTERRRLKAERERRRNGEAMGSDSPLQDTINS